MKKRERDVLDRALSTCQKILDGTAVSVRESPEVKGARIARLLADYNAFTHYYFPHYAQSHGKPTDCAWFHVQLAEAMRDHPRFYGQAEWPRAHAKTTHLAIILPMWLKAQGLFHTYLVVGKSFEKAADSLTDLQNELAANERYASDFGEQYNPAEWKEGQFVTRDGTSFHAFGLKQSTRGLRNRQYRPDYIVVDDIDDEEWMNNPVRVTGYMRKIESAIYGTMDMGRGRFLVSGNRIHPDAIVARFARKAEKVKDYYYSQVRAIMQNEAGERVPAWPEKYTLEEIELTMARMDPRMAAQEYMNQPEYGGGSFQERHIKWAAQPVERAADSRIIYIDPSYKPSKLGDFKAAVVVSRVGQTFHVHRVFCRRCDLRVLIAWCYALAGEYQKLGHSWPVYIEGELQQQLLLREFDAYGKEVGQAMRVTPDLRKKPNKHRRIAEMARYFEQGQVTLELRERENPDMEELVRQLLSFSGARNLADDGPDALEGALYKVQRMSATPSLQIASRSVGRPRRLARTH
jgi:hypothetical protein